MSAALERLKRLELWNGTRHRRRALAIVFSPLRTTASPCIDHQQAVYSAYAADRDRNKETLLAKQFSNNAIRNPDILSSLTLHRDHPVPTGRAALAQQ